jgi:hypothetical protein
MLKEPFLSASDQFTVYYQNIESIAIHTAHLIKIIPGRDTVNLTEKIHEALQEESYGVSTTDMQNVTLELCNYLKYPTIIDDFKSNLEEKKLDHHYRRKWIQDIEDLAISKELLEKDPQLCIACKKLVALLLTNKLRSNNIMSVLVRVGELNKILRYENKRLPTELIDKKNTIYTDIKILRSNPFSIDELPAYDVMTLSEKQQIVTRTEDLVMHTVDYFLSSKETPNYR